LNALRLYSRLLQERISIAVETTILDIMIEVLESLQKDSKVIRRALPAELQPTKNFMVLNQPELLDWLGYSVTGGVPEFSNKGPSAYRNLRTVLNLVITDWLNDPIKRQTKDTKKKMKYLYNMFEPRKAGVIKKGNIHDGTISYFVSNLQGKLILWDLIMERILKNDSLAAEQMLVVSTSHEPDKTESILELEAGVHRHLIGRSNYVMVSRALFRGAGKKKGLMALCVMFVEFVTSGDDLKNLLSILGNLTNLEGVADIRTQYLKQDIETVPKVEGLKIFHSSPMSEADIDYILRLFVEPVNDLHTFFSDHLYNEIVKYALEYTETEDYKKTCGKTKWEKGHLPKKRIQTVVVAMVNSAWLKIIRLIGPVILPTSYGDAVCGSKY
jgi:hypothetical protein